MPNYPAANINESLETEAKNTDSGQLLKETRGKTVQKNPAAVVLGRLGGLKGGKARAAKLSAQKRKEIAQKAAKARWGKQSP
jgi:hypothetical protein